MHYNKQRAQNAQKLVSFWTNLNISLMCPNSILFGLDTYWKSSNIFCEGPTFYFLKFFLD